MGRRLREVRAYLAEAVTFVDFVKLVRVRLSQSRIGPIVCPRPVTVVVGLRSMKGKVSLRSHSTDISVLNELIVWDIYGTLREHATEPVRTIVDLGANIGLAARWLLALFPAASIVCVEPEPGNLRMLERNLAPFPDRATIVSKCIGGAERRTGLSTTSGAWGYEMTDGDEFDVTTMDSLGLDRIDVLKCNIEGAERELFAAPAEWIDRTVLAVIEWHGDGNAEHLAELKDWRVIEHPHAGWVTLG